VAVRISRMATAIPPNVLRPAESCIPFLNLVGFEVSAPHKAVRSLNLFVSAAPQYSQYTHARVYSHHTPNG
jgi:hypothetical protein